MKNGRFINILHDRGSIIAFRNIEAMPRPAEAVAQTDQPCSNCL